MPIIYFLETVRKGCAWTNLTWCACNFPLLFLSLRLRSPPTAGFPHMQIQVNSRNHNDISARRWTWTLRTCSRGSDWINTPIYPQSVHTGALYPSHQSTVPRAKKRSRNLLKHADTNQRAKDSTHKKCTRLWTIAACFHSFWCPPTQPPTSSHLALHFVSSCVSTKKVRVNGRVLLLPKLLEQ